MNHAKYDDMTGAPLGSHWPKRKLAIAVAIIMLVAISAYPAYAYFSNALDFGSFSATSPSATLTRVDAPDTYTNRNVNPTLSFGIAYPYGSMALPDPASDVFLAIPYKFGVRLQSTTGHGDIAVQMHYTITYTGSQTISASSVTVQYFNPALVSATGWVASTATFDATTKTWTGTLSAAPLTIGPNWDATYEGLITFNVQGGYSISVWCD